MRENFVLREINVFLDEFDPFVFDLCKGHFNIRLHLAYLPTILSIFGVRVVLNESFEVI